MSRTLILTRHGKSDWGGTEDDFDRALAPRGERSAAALGTWLAEEGLRPNTALVSSARRTVETYAGIAAALGEAPEPALKDNLYHAAPFTILDEVRKAEGETVLLVGHNPGIAMAAAALVSAAPDHPRFDDYPTGATTVIRFDIDDWRDLAEGTGTVAAFVIPREL